jgi:AcrR family transcriptional regulator
LVAEEGLERASINRLASRLGVSSSLVVHYYPTKEQLVASMVERFLQTYEGGVLERIRRTPDPVQRLRLSLEALFSADWQDLVDDPVYYACRYLSVRDSSIREHWLAMIERLIEQLKVGITDCVAAGAIPACDTEAIADFIACLENGYGDFTQLFDDDERGTRLRQYILTLLADNLGLPPR